MSKFTVGMTIYDAWGYGPYKVLRVEEYDRRNPHLNVEVIDTSNRVMNYDQHDLQLHATT